ncbi:3-oxoacyl-[acyl-carrier-protein] reductase [Geomicrobium sp. JCM 19039]|uniref:3-oxoacyl-[acyl-carrier-protein] reductase n=1 Tax=Geomicrobium sp. JCM 19039 TaxID=1460636 RepID=UPI00045F1FB1|nr:3-oxoacyl-[acyl-carrier-protein] reductase [Geomicrobium sp. JCM 19039]GAK10882.1 3-oxoacyl-[acyl-carrier protein] reductase [Geomicrobium sp. JCM 19039]
MNLNGKKALVTGGSRGIGRAIAVALAKQGADVAINYAGNAAKADEVKNECIAEGVQAFTIQADVASEDDVKNMFQEVQSQFGGIDLLINNAGITRDNLVMRMKSDDWDAVIDTNLKGVFLCSKAASRPMMKQRSGAIINIASVVGSIGNAGQANYTAAKAGVLGLTKTLAREFAARNIRVNAVAPGFISTEMTDQLDEQTRVSLLANIPLNELGKPEDIAEAVVFLASDASRYMTGQTLHVDGGMYMG